MKDQENTLLCQIESLKAEHATKLQDEFQRARDELESGHIEQLQTFRHASQETTEQVRMGCIFKSLRRISSDWMKIHPVIILSCSRDGSHQSSTEIRL